MSKEIDPRQVSYVGLSELKPDPRNPKAHDDEVIDQSIGRFGVIDLIVRDERTGYTISGHGRTKALTAMQERGESAPEGVRVDEQSGEWLVPVVTGWASRTDAEASAALIALNRTTELGGWVDESLLELLDELSEVEDGFRGVGFEEHDLEDLRNYIDSVEAAYNPPEEYEEDEEGDGEYSGGEVGTVTLRGTQVVVNVVILEEDREQLYADLHKLDYLIDARDSMGA